MLIINHFIPNALHNYAYRKQLINNALYNYAYDKEN